MKDEGRRMKRGRRWGERGAAVEAHKDMGCPEARKTLGLERGIVRIAGHEAGWLALGAEACEGLRRAAGELALEVQHVGSTAVGGLPAKPILDIVVGVRTADGIADLIDRFTRIGYLYRGYGGAGIGHLFVREVAPLVRSIHVHVVEHGGREWRDYVVFRDRLREDGEARRRYAELKTELARRFPADRWSYVAGKDDFIQEAIGSKGSARIRRPTPEDAEELAGMLCEDEELRRDLGMGEGEKPTGAGFLSRVEAWCASRNAVTYAIVASGRAVGSISLSHIDIGSGSAGIGYWMGSRYRGLGYCKDAFALVVEEARRRGLRLVGVQVDSDNAASRRIWEGMGARGTDAEGGKVRYELVIMGEEGGGYAQAGGASREGDEQC